MVIETNRGFVQQSWRKLALKLHVLPSVIFSLCNSATLKVFSHQMCGFTSASNSHLLTEQDPSYSHAHTFSPLSFPLTVKVEQTLELLLRLARTTDILRVILSKLLSFLPCEF